MLLEGIRAVELGPHLSRQLIEAQQTMTSFQADLTRLDMSVSCIDCGLSPRELFSEDGAEDRIASAAGIANSLGCSLLKVPAPAPDTDPKVALGRLRAACEAAGPEITVVIENTPISDWDTGPGVEKPMLALTGECNLGFAFNPAHFANVDEKPYLNTWRKTKLKRYTRIIYATDGCHPGRPQYTRLLEGNAEVKELLSIFRARGYGGFVTLKMGDRRGTAAFRQHAAAFRRLLETS